MGTILKKLLVGLVILVSCIGFTMATQAQELSDSAKALQKSKHVLEVFEFDKDVLVWVDHTLNGYCDYSILYVYIGLDANGKRLYNMLTGTCENATDMKKHIIKKKRWEDRKDGY